MWVVFWSGGGVEACYTAEDARFVYALIRMGEYDAKILYLRTYN
jgi:hypothetical protein